MLRKVDISIDLIREWCAEGNVITFARGGSAVCVEGVSPAAELQRAYIRQDGHTLTLILDDPNYTGISYAPASPMWRTRHED